MRHFSLLVGTVLLGLLSAGIASAQNVPLPRNNGQVPQTPAQLQQQMQQALQGQGTMTVQDIMRLNRMLMPSHHSNGPRIPQTITQNQQAQQAYLQQQAAIAAAEAQKKAERREKIKQSIIARKQQEEAQAKARQANK